MLYRIYNPFEEMERIQKEMNLLFDDSRYLRGKEFPLVNIWSNPDTAITTTELPGYDPDEISISVTNDELIIQGTRKRPELKETDSYHRQEITYGSFNRSIQLPFSVNGEKVTAEFKNGILKITLPRLESTKPKKIEIKTK